MMELKLTTSDPSVRACHSNPDYPAVCERDEARPGHCVHCGRQRTDREFDAAAAVGRKGASECEVVMAALMVYHELLGERVAAHDRGVRADDQSLDVVHQHRVLAWELLEKLTGEELCPSRTAARPRLGPCVESIANVGRCTWCKRPMR